MKMDAIYLAARPFLIKTDDEETLVCPIFGSRDRELLVQRVPLKEIVPSGS